MKFDSRRTFLALIVTTGLSFFGATQLTAAVQDRRYDERDRRDRERNSPEATAARMGEEDGLNDGRKDRATGHSDRPTQGDNYKKATRGFGGGAGETAYKAAYRRAYVPAYERGYNERDRGRR